MAMERQMESEQQIQQERQKEREINMHRKRMTQKTAKKGNQTQRARYQAVNTETGSERKG